VRPPRTGHASLNLVAAAESERLTRVVVRPKICTDELCRVVRNSTSKRDPKRKFKLTDGHADCFARARICVCVCVRQLWCCFQPQELQQSTYVAKATSSIHQATVPERGHRFLLATRGDTAGWGIRRYNEMFFSVYQGFLFLFIQLQQVTFGYL
jgi:hypothetical protein